MRLYGNKSLSPGRGGGKADGEVYPRPKCGRGKPLPYEYERSRIVRLPAMNAQTRREA